MKHSVFNIKKKMGLNGLFFPHGYHMVLHLLYIVHRFYGPLLWFIFFVIRIFGFCILWRKESFIKV